MSFKIDTTQFNQVDYFGLLLNVPNEYEYIATDKDGDICAFTHAPRKKAAVFACRNDDTCAQDYTVLVRGLEHIGDWKQSLKKVSDILVREPVLDASAKVGAAIFDVGIAHKTVVEAAQRQYVYHEQEKLNAQDVPTIPLEQQVKLLSGDYVLVPKEPEIDRLNSMALRYRHDFGLLGAPMQGVIIRDMFKIYREATGQGFYKHEAEQELTND